MRPARYPVLSPSFRFGVAPREGVALLSTDGATILEGALYERLVPLLDGRRTADAIADALGDDTEPAEVHYALARLQRVGALADTARQGRPSRRTHTNGTTAAHGPSVELVTLGIDRTSARLVLRVAGWRVRSGETVQIVLADDLLNPDVRAVADQRTDGPWLLAVPTAQNPSVGPLFQRGQGPCYECLAHRVARNRAIESYLLARGVTPRRMAPGTDGDLLALRRVVQRARRLLASPAAADSALYTWDAGAWLRHEVARRPQCPACGDRTLSARAGKQSWPEQRDALGSVPIASRADLVDPITGVVTELLAHPVPALPALHICIASTGSTRGRRRLADVLRDLRHQTSGRGATADEAVAGAFGEAVERYSGVWQGDEPHVRATLDSLGAGAIHPDHVLCFSRAQQRARLRHNRRAAPSARVPAPFSSSTPIDWTPVWSLTRGEERWLPSSLLYYGHPESVKPGYCYADSNGCAAGPTRDAALASGLLELMERDAVAMWWYNRVRHPPVDIAAVGDPWCDAMVDAFHASGREIWALDLTNDLQLPTVAAVSRRLTGQSEAILLGFGAHPDRRMALRRAIGEVGQMFAATATFEQAESIIEPDVHEWLMQARVRDHMYLQPALRRRPGRALDCETGSEVQLARLVDMLQGRGFEILVLDQSRPDIGVPVVRVVVPGLRHFWPRLGPGRLYDVPLRLGWIPKARTEEDLNPTAFFL